MSNWERGKSIPSPENLRKAAILYGVKPRELADLLFKLRISEANTEWNKIMGPASVRLKRKVRLSEGMEA